MPDSWRREAPALLAEARKLGASIPEKQRAAHIRSCRDDPAGIVPIIGAVPGWLKADDAVGDEVRRGDHLLRVCGDMWLVREYNPSTSRTVAWNGTEPLVRGDRLQWSDRGEMHDMIVEEVGRVAGPAAIGTEPLVRGDRLQWSDRGEMHDMIVEEVGRVAGPAAIGHLVLRPTAAAIAGRSNETLSLSGHEVAGLAGNVSCRRLAWPDERVRQRELERQYAFADTTYSLVCDGRVVVGDRIRWTMVRDAEALRDQLEGDTPQVEAVVESIAGNVRFPGEDQVTLKAIRSWGMGSPPEPGATIHQRMGSLFLRGCVRVPWQDEEKRAERVLQAEQEAQSLRRGRSRGLSM